MSREWDLETRRMVARRRPPSWAMSSVSSTLWLEDSFPSWAEALAFAVRGRPNFADKPKISHDWGTWRVRYAPRIIVTNQAPA